MDKEIIPHIQEQAIDLLKQLIAIPSFSKEENETTDVIENIFKSNDIPVQRYLNNVWAVNKYFNSSKPTILLNSHHDTVKPNKGYTKNPFTAVEEDGKLYGLGSNDAGGALVSLMATFFYFYDKIDLEYNLIFAATAEEEISGANGIEALLPHIGAIDFAIVGEPTDMQMAVAERGLLVLDCTVTGKAGHAARNEGENALYKALIEIDKLQKLKFERVSDLLDKVNLNVTVIETDNKAHNVIPATCRFVVDVRVNELYSLEEVVEKIRSELNCKVNLRSLRLRSTSMSLDHPLVKAGKALGKKIYGSPTTSDKALMPFPALKIGPGDSARSHTADEFIFIKEISDGIEDYINILNNLL